MGLGTAEGIVTKLGYNAFAFNWGEEDELKQQLDGLIQEVSDQLMLDAGLAYFYSSGSAAQKRLLAAAEEWKGAYLALLRPAVFKLLGEHAPLAMEDSESFDRFLDRLLARSQELIEDLLGATPSTETALGPVSHGFKDPDGELYELPVTRLSRW